MSHNKVDYQIKKKEAFEIKATTRFSGATKNDFMSDLIKRGVMESQLLKSIVKLHYKVLDANNIPRSEDMKTIESKLCNPCKV